MGWDSGLHKKNRVSWAPEFISLCFLTMDTMRQSVVRPSQPWRTAPLNCEQSTLKLLLLGNFSLQWETQLTSISILMTWNLSLMNPTTVRTPARIHYVAGNQRKLNLGLKPNQTTGFPRTVIGVLYRPSKAKTVRFITWSTVTEGVYVLPDSGHLPACCRSARAD